MNKADIGLIGLAVMGENLALNIESRGYKVAVYNRTVSKVDELTAGRAKGKNMIGCATVKDLCSFLKKPRMVIMMVKAGEATDKTIEGIIPHLEKGDIIIDGGNSLFEDTVRRQNKLEEIGLYYIGSGISGGEEGALKGPSIMPGGSYEAWKFLEPVFKSISAKVDGNVPCCEWVGKGGAGHFVKMVHNGIEYGDMQIICEAYHIMKNILSMSEDEMSSIFAGWNMTTAAFWEAFQNS